MMLDELVKTALVGTGRAAAVELPPGPVAEAVAAVPTTDPESRLLAAVAVLSQYEACGRVPVVADVPPAAAADARPACSPRAADLLGRVLAMPQTNERKQLVREWLAHANAAGRRLPHALLPAMLDYAVKLKEARPAVTAAADARGAWLMGLNPQWRIGVAADDDPAAVWGVGTFDQRLSALNRMRAADPRAAVGLIRSTWADDPADHRQAFASALAAGLGPDDEPFLEAALDDRSRTVAAVAARLLCRLPGSALARRMVDRAEAMLSFTAGTKSGLLKSGKAAAITVTLPETLDPAWARDGVPEPAARGQGQKQGWVRTIVSHVPAAHWSTAWGVDPAACMAAVPADFRPLLLDAWAEASVDHPDAAWVSALLAAGGRRGDNVNWLEMVDALPAAEQRAVVTDLIRSPATTAERLREVLDRTTFPFDAAAADVLTVAVERHARGAVGSRDWETPQLLAHVGRRVPPAMHDVLAERWADAGWDGHRRPVDDCLAVLGLRLDIQREFAT